MRPVTVKPDAGYRSELYPRAAERGVPRREGLSIVRAALPWARCLARLRLSSRAHCVPRGARAQVVFHSF